MTADCVGGVWAYALELSRALTALEVQVHLATMGRLPNAVQRAESAAVAGLTVHASEFRLEWMADAWDDIAKAGEWLLELERRVEPDVVHLNGYVHAALRFRAPTLVVAHSCVCSWWSAVRGEEAPPEWDRYRAEVRAGLRAAEMVIAPTATMLAALERHYGVGFHGHVISNGRPASRFPPLEKELFVLAAGRAWDEAKNVEALVRAAEQAAWNAFIAGEQSPPAGVGDASQGPRGAAYLGPLPPEDLARWMGHAAVYALPARYEPFGLSALEAALAGCALVLGDIPSLREVWGEAPLYVRPDDDRMLCRVISALLQDSALRAEVARRCRARAAQYTPERMRDGYLRAYGGLRPASAASPASSAAVTSPGHAPGAHACV